jgi:hypothetical protein
MVLNNLFGEHQTKPGTAVFLGGEKRLEDFARMSRFDPMSVIDDEELDAISASPHPKTKSSPLRYASSALAIRFEIT